MQRKSLLLGGWYKHMTKFEYIKYKKVQELLEMDRKIVDASCTGTQEVIEQYKVAFDMVNSGKYQQDINDEDAQYEKLKNDFEEKIKMMKDKIASLEQEILNKETEASDMSFFKKKQKELLLEQVQEHKREISEIIPDLKNAEEQYAMLNERYQLKRIAMERLAIEMDEAVRSCEKVNMYLQSMNRKCSEAYQQEMIDNYLNNTAFLFEESDIQEEIDQDIKQVTISATKADKKMMDLQVLRHGVLNLCNAETISFSQMKTLFEKKLVFKFSATELKEIIEDLLQRDIITTTINENYKITTYGRYIYESVCDSNNPKYEKKCKSYELTQEQEAIVSKIKDKLVDMEWVLDALTNRKYYVSDIVDYARSKEGGSLSSPRVASILKQLQEYGAVDRAVIKGKPTFSIIKNSVIDTEEAIVAYFISLFLEKIETIMLSNLLEIINQEHQLELTESRLTKIIKVISTVQISGDGKQKVVEYKKS